MNIEELQEVVANPKTSLEQYLALTLIHILKKHPPIGYAHNYAGFDDGKYASITKEPESNYKRPLYGTPPVKTVDLNHIGRITAQISGQRYTYLSAEDVRHVFEEMGCNIIEDKRERSPYVWFPEIK